MNAQSNLKISACIDMMFAGEELEQRIVSIKDCGLDAVEMWKWSNKDIDLMKRIMAEQQLSFAIMNIDSKNEALSYDLSRGILNAGRKEDFVQALQESIPIYHQLGASGLIVLIGETIPDMEYSRQAANITECLRAAAPIAEANGITLLVEPLNNIDRKNYFMPYSAPLLEILKQVNSPHVKMLYDIYHQNMMGDFSMEEIRQNIDLIGHFHVADCPGRHEPGTGTVDYASILKEIATLPYSGYVGLEYRALRPDKETMGFLEEVRV